MWFSLSTIIKYQEKKFTTIEDFQEILMGVLIEKLSCLIYPKS